MIIGTKKSPSFPISFQILFFEVKSNSWGGGSQGGGVVVSYPGGGTKKLTTCQIHIEYVAHSVGSKKIWATTDEEIVDLGIKRVLFWRH